MGAVAQKSQPWQVAPEDFFTTSEHLRGLFGRLIGTDAEGVALIPAVSYGVATAINNMSFQPGDRIVVLDEQFPSNIYGWQTTARSSGAQVVTVARPIDHDWTAAVLAVIDDGTAAVAVPNVHWTDGSFVDLVTIGAAARSVGARLIVDATQSLGALYLDVAEVQPDFLIAAGYKTLLGPYSLGYMWMSEEHRLGDPLEQGWIGRAGSEDFSGLADYKSDYQPGARRFDVGERSNFVLVPMAVAALTQILAWGTENIAGYVSGLTNLAESLATEVGLEPIPAGRRGPNLMGVRIPGGPPGDLSKRLAQKDIYVSVRGDSLRIAPHVYNTDLDIVRLFEVLLGLLKQ